MLEIRIQTIFDTQLSQMDPGVFLTFFFVSHLILCRRAKTVTAVIAHTQIQFCFQCNNLNSKYTCTLAQPGPPVQCAGLQVCFSNKSSQYRR